MSPGDPVPPVSPGPPVPPVRSGAPGWRARLALALPIAFGYGILLYLLIWTGRDNQTPFIAGLLATPMAVGGTLSALLDPAGRQTLATHAALTLLLIALLILTTFIVFSEGVICMIMAAPLMFVFALLGTALTRFLARRIGSPRDTLVIIALPLLIHHIEPALTYPPQSASVTTVIEIAAPPQVVWAQTVAIPAIAATELPFTFSHGVIGTPRPLDASLEGRGMGAVRQLRWTGGVHFQEIVTEWHENHRLAWRFHFGPGAIPEALRRHVDPSSAYLHLADGEYLLEPLPGGETRLTLTTHYTLATPLDAYFRFWGRVFLNDFHRAVLTVIKARSEALVPARL